MVKHAVAQNHVKLFGLQAGSKQVHLYEPHPLQPIVAPKPFSKPEGIEAQIRSNHAPQSDPEKVAELAGPAAYLKHRAVAGNAMIQRLPVNASSCLVNQRSQRIMLLIVRERCLFIKGLD